ncbi:MAG TPA: hypothetical protein VK636_16870 [Gemmatimonadaceae bacterium]|nr:hypothetical protein [Gemmatimonadaceae bacterium]
MRNLSTAPSGYALAPSDNAMIYAILAAGTAAAFFVDPMFWLATPVFGVILFKASKRAAPAPPLELPEGETSEMPMRVELAILDAVSRLPLGDARRLLADVVRQARPLFGTTSSNFDAARDEETRTEAADLVLACCDTALELAKLDTVLIQGAKTGGSDLKSRDPKLFARYSDARTLFATRLSDAAGALGALYASGVERGTPASDRIGELVTDLTADAAARSEAKRELDQLLEMPARKTSTSSKV